MTDTVRGAAAVPATAPVAVPPSDAVPGTVNAALLREAQQHYERALAAQRAGNWAEYGREIELLGATLRRLRADGGAR